MTPSFSCARKSCVAAFALITAGCSQGDAPETGALVILEPGRYEVKLADGGSSNRAKSKQATVCLNHSEAATFPYTMVESYYKFHPGCTTQREPQQGDKIAGSITCPTDEKVAAGTSSFIFTGKVSADAATASGHIEIDPGLDTSSLSKEQAAQLKLGAAMMERLTIVIEAKRIGTCA